MIRLYLQTDRFHRFEPHTGAGSFKLAYSVDALYPEPASTDEALNTIFSIFNIAHPSDYEERSLSVGDVIEYDDTLFAIERVGFKQIDDISNK